MRIIRRPLFLTDVEECAAYLVAEAGGAVAQRWKKSLAKAINQIAKFPELGRLRGDLPIPGIRTYFLKDFPRYLIFYRLQGDCLELLRVRQGMMHLPALFETGGQAPGDA
jgi:plasmid stabilization system protein ParE